MSDEQEKPELDSGLPTELPAGEAAEEEFQPDPEGVEAVRSQNSNDYFRAMMDRNFLEYASYVIKDRAIPDVDDGLKPVQRRILWALYEAYDGRTHKAANIIGNAMHFHPHGDASIGDALVVLANKEYYITKQGNFGNIFTGSPAAAPRYIECSLSPLAYEVLFNNDITELVDSYDGRSREPVTLPAKVPSLLMLGSDGIAVGMATRIMPHNFNELLEAEIAVLRGEPFELYPDFQQGGLMDVREYNDGNGKITLRAKIEIDGRRLVVREIPATTTTESLIASIEKAAEKNKIKISSVTDYTAEQVEIEIVPTRGYDPEKTLQALYMYTDCAVSISVNLTVIRDSRPVQMSVSEVLKRNTAKLLDYLRQELEIDLGRQEELFHAKTLAQIFFENRIYKRIEECGSEAEEYAEVHAGLAPFRHLLRRDVTDADVDKLLALPVRRISRFDIEKNQRELAEILAKMEEIRKNLGSLKKYAINYLKRLLEKYGKNYPRRTEIEHFEKIDRREAALNNIKVGWDRRNGYIGTSIKSDDILACNEFDRFLCVEKSGAYKVIALPPEKLFIGKLYDFRKYDAATEFGVVYRETRSGKYYGKRSSIGGFILDKEYTLCPHGCKLELLTPRADAIYTLTLAGARGRQEQQELNLMELPARTPKARGILIASKALMKITHERYLTEEELAVFRSKMENDGEVTDENDENSSPDSAPTAPAEGKVPAPEVTKELSTHEPVSPAETAEDVPVENASVLPETTEHVSGDAPVVPEMAEDLPAAVPEAAENISGDIPVVSEMPEETPEQKSVDVAGKRRKKLAKSAVSVPAADDDTPPWRMEGEQEPPESVSASGQERVEAVVDQESLDLGLSPAKPAHRRPRVKSVPKPPAKPAGDSERPENSDEDDEFGIVQPEFGF